MQQPIGRPRKPGTLRVPGWILPILLLAADPAGAADPEPAAEPATNALAAAAPADVKPETPEPAKETGPGPSLREFILRPGFRIELVASDPALASPAAMAFDEQGRLFVAEMRDYPDRRGSSPHLGRIRMLEDPDGQGKYAGSTIFAEDLPWPSALACFDGGLFVAATPDIYYLKDTDNNGIADVRKLLFSGIGGTNTPLADRMIRALEWGPDGRIHVATSGAGGQLTAVATPQPMALDLARSDFSFDPFNFVPMLQSPAGSGGIAFDMAGRKYSAGSTRPVRLTLLEARYARRNPFAGGLEESADAASPATTVFAYPREAPDPKARTGNGTNLFSPAWLTSARGICIYHGGIFPTNYPGSVFVADPDHHLIHRFVLRENGLVPVALRPGDEAGTEFLVSKDEKFRPERIVVGPEGALYIADFREGGDSGRLYRIVPQGFKHGKALLLAKATPLELANALVSTNGWQAQTAARLLLEKRDPAALPLLSNMLHTARSSGARLAAFRLLQNGGGLRPDQVLRALGDHDELVRLEAVCAAETLAPNGIFPDAIWGAFRRLVADPSVRVRHQLAQTLGQAQTPQKIPLLAQLLRDRPADPWMQEAVLSSLTEGGGDVFVALAPDSVLRTIPAFQDLLRRLAGMIGARGRVDEVVPVVNFFVQTRPERLAGFTLLADLGEGLRRNGSSLAAVDADQRLMIYYADALKAATTEPNAPEPLRIAAIRLLGFSSYRYADIGDVLLLMLGSGQPPRVQAAALGALLDLRDPRLMASLLARWPILSPALRTEALTALVYRNETLLAVLAALKNGNIRPFDFSPTTAEFLRAYPDPSISQIALQTLGPSTPQRSAVVDRFRPALSLTGSAARGRSVFLARCAGCHRVNGEGRNFGPDLVGARIGGKEALLRSILEPGARIRPDFETYVVTSRDGFNAPGLFGAEGPGAVAVRLPGGPAAWPRLNVAGLQLQPWSLMPDGLEAGLNPQGLADLIAYILSAR